MSPIKKLSNEAIEQKMVEIPGWKLENGKLLREFQFDDFVRAFAFMCSVALVAERLNHHPEWSNVYGRVRISLQTHDISGISESDFALAGAANRYGGEP